jgi:extracellular factor (EF) 3-hydroxypalmitic acid methyl ester biosynthesis protein
MSSERFLRFLEPAEEAAVLAASPVKSFAAGEVILDRDVSLRAIFVIDQGAVRVEQGTGKDLVTLAVLGPGQFFGEMSFVVGTPTSARVVANVRTELRLIDMATVDNLSEVDPTFAARLYRSIAAILVERLRLTSMEILVQKPWV